MTYLQNRYQYIVYQIVPENKEEITRRIHEYQNEFAKCIYESQRGNEEDSFSWYTNS